MTSSREKRSRPPKRSRGVLRIEAELTKAGQNWSMPTKKACRPRPNLALISLDTAAVRPKLTELVARSTDPGSNWARFGLRRRRHRRFQSFESGSCANSFQRFAPLAFRRENGIGELGQILGGFEHM